MVHVRMIKTSRRMCHGRASAFGCRLSSPILGSVSLPSRVAALAGQRAQTDLDAFMAGVLERRDENWKKLQQYLLEERERIELKGPSSQILWGEDRTYMWYIRDGFFVRSPLVANGVSVPEQDRRRYEDEFLARARNREKKPDSEDQVPAAAEAPPDTDLGGSGEAVATTAVH